MKEVITYIPKGVCSKQMTIKIENDIIKDVKIVGGCPGNSLGVSILCKDRNIDEVIEKLSGIKCGFKNTSCPDQISKALLEFKNEKQKVQI